MAPYGPAGARASTVWTCSAESVNRGECEAPSRDEGGYGGRSCSSDGLTLDRRLSREVERQGVVFSDLHAAAREQPELFRAHFMTEAVQPIAWKLVALHAALWKGGVFLYAPAGADITVPLHARVAASGRRSRLPAHPRRRRRGQQRHPRRRARFRRERAASLQQRRRRNPRATRRARCATSARRTGAAAPTISPPSARSSAKTGRLELGLVGTGGSMIEDQRRSQSFRRRAPAPSIVGLFLAAGEQHMSYVTLQDHRARSTTSDLLLKSAIKDSAQLVWNGLTRIRKGAGESDANQTSRNLLLGENARVAPIPVLEIEAHDVARCSHGATVSSVDEEQLYYMMSRGLSRREATEAIVDGFFRAGAGAPEPRPRARFHRPRAGAPADWRRRPERCLEFVKAAADAGHSSGNGQSGRSEGTADSNLQRRRRVLCRRRRLHARRRSAGQRQALRRRDRMPAPRRSLRRSHRSRGRLSRRQLQSAPIPSVSSTRRRDAVASRRGRRRHNV